MNAELPEAFLILFRVIDIFDELGIDYHVGGSYASSVHGIPRQTQDIDLVLRMDENMIDQLAAGLENEFYLDRDDIRRAVSDKGSANLIHLETGIKIDLFMHGGSPFDNEEFARARPEVLWLTPERHVNIKSAEDTVLRKLQWYRLGGEISDRQWNDVSGIIKSQGNQLDMDYLQQWSKELGVEDLLARVFQSGPQGG